MGSSDVDRENFWDHGPTHLTQTKIDWENDEHRRCITASLVKAVYVLESDRTKKREGNNALALAPAWWDNFHFDKLDEFKLEHACKCVICKMLRRRMFGSRPGRKFIYGAVFKYTQPDHPTAPSHVVAFRGTMTKDPTFLSDMLQNLGILFDRQHMCSRFVDARKIVQRLVSDHNGNASRGEVWLAGHSLGASIALDVGRDTMIHRGLNLPTFLFNPPHVSLPPAIGYFLRYGLSIVTPSSNENHMEEVVFEKLATWVPNLYVNPLDALCKGYIAYFEERERMMCRSMRGKQSERPHLLPSAILWKNMGSHKKSAHGLRQWWRPSSHVSLAPAVVFNPVHLL